MPTPAHELYIRCRTKTLDLLRRLPYTNTTAARGCSNQQEIEVTAATVRKNVRKWAAWAAAHPYPGGAGGVRAWVRTGVASVVGSRGPDLIYLALMGKELPPSWTPEGAAHRLERAVDHHPLTRAALAVSAAALAMERARFLSAFSPEEAAFVGAYMDAPVAALEGRMPAVAPIASAKSSVVAAKSAIRSARLA